MSNPEIVYDSDQDVSEHHSKLIEAVSQLDKGQRVKKAERSEPTLEVSEYHLVKSGITDKNAVHVKDLAKSLGHKGYQRDITKKLQSVQQKNKILSKPLEKPAAERVKRIVGFENTKKEVGKWSAIIAKNRTADHLFFPLITPKETLKNSPTTEFLNRFRLKSDFQKKLEDIDPKPQEPPALEERDQYHLMREEVILKRKEAARLRAQQSYKEAKAQRQRKIKSKKFHRIQRKEKTKQQLKEFEELKKTNPEEALAKLEQLDKSRAEERASLRHKSTGQWAKNKQIRAKYNKEARQVLAEQLAISRELTQKVGREDNSDNEDDVDEIPLVLSSNDKENPWMNNVKTESEINEFVKSYRKYWDGKNKNPHEGKVMEIDIGSTSSLKENTVNNKLKEQKSEETNKADGVIDSTSSTKQKTEKPIEIKNAIKKMNMDYTVIPDKTVSRNEKVKSRNRKNGIKSKDACNTDATSAWNVEEIQCNVERKGRITKLEDIDDMFDIVEKNIKRKVDLKLQKVKKKLTESKVNEQEERKGKRKEDEDYSPNLEFKESKRKPILDLPLEETTSRGSLQQDTDLTSLQATASMMKESVGKPNAQEAEIDPQKYLNVKPKHLKTQLPDSEAGCDETLDNSEEEDETHRIMSEAFADDDVVEEFRKEKEEEIKKSQPEDIDLRLPGWGSWAGANVKKSKVVRKKRRFILKFPKDTQRKDENKGDVIIFEGDNEKLKEHLVNELPYPFSSVQDFEASIRAPLGRTFIPENAHIRLVQPMVNTRLGQVIEPMTEDVLVKKQPVLKRRKPQKTTNNVNDKNDSARSKKKRKQNTKN